MPDQKLMDYFKFDENDLQANRGGQLTEKQRKLLVSDNNYDRGFNWIGAAFLLLLAVAGVVVAIGALFRTTDTGTRLQFGLICGCLWPVIWVGLSLRPLRRALAGFQVQVKKAQGPANIVKAERTSTSTRSDGTSSTSHYFVYELHIAPTVFEVGAELADIMLQGETYALYYTEGSERTILSAERITQA